MNEFQQYIAELKTKKGIKNDLQLSKTLGCSYCLIHRITKEGKFPSWKLCSKLAKLDGDHSDREVFWISSKTKLSNMRLIRLGQVKPEIIQRRERFNPETNSIEIKYYEYRKTW